LGPNCNLSDLCSWACGAQNAQMLKSRFDSNLTGFAKGEFGSEFRV
jgi:hypothetical protein